MSSRRSREPRPDSVRIDKRVDRAWRALRLPSGRHYSGWYTSASQAVGEHAADAFTQLHAKDAGQLAGWVAQDFEYARVLYGGWFGNAILAQSRWLANQLAPLVVAHPDPLIVDVGGGLGFYAAVLSSALRTRVISVDPLPGSAEIAEKLSTLTGGEVEPHEAEAEQLAEILNGRKATSLYLVGALRHLQPHVHSEAPTFAHASQIKKAVDNAVPEQAATELFTAAAGAPIYALEVTCPDWIGELEGIGRGHGYHIHPLSPGLLGLEMIDDKPKVATLHLSTQAPAPTVDDLLAATTNYPLPSMAGGLKLAGSDAELARRRLGIGLVIDGAELQYRDATARIELASSDSAAWCYTSSTLDYRALEVFDSERTARQEYQKMIEAQSSLAMVSTLTTPATFWK